jgi:hypothetical protein
LATGKQIHTFNYRINNCLDVNGLFWQCPQLSSQEMPTNFGQIFAITTHYSRQCSKERPSLMGRQPLKD